MSSSTHTHLWEEVVLINSVYYVCKRCDCEATKCSKCKKFVVGENTEPYEYCQECQYEDTFLLDELELRESLVEADFSDPYAEEPYSDIFQNR